MTTRRSMIRRRRGQSVFDQLLGALWLGTLAISDPRVNRAVTAGHEAAHAVLADMYGTAADVYLDDAAGETYHEVALRIVGTDDARAVRSRENALICLAGPASETLMFPIWALVGTGSAHAFLAAWRLMAREHPDESSRESCLAQLFAEARQLLLARWSLVANVAGHLLEQGELRAGQVQRILRGVEPDRSQVFLNALRGIA